MVNGCDGRGCDSRMIHAYWCLCANNFGDLLTRYWIERLTATKVEWVPPDQAEMFGCGSILDSVPIGFTGMLLGTGAMFAERKRHDLKRADIRVLRGPLTARLIFGDPEAGREIQLGDLGVLFVLKKPDVAKDCKVGSLPHYDDREPYKSDCHLDIRGGIETVVDQVARCERIVSSSLHGIILADALGVENKWVDCPRVRGGGFKFRDYAASLGESIEPGVWRLGNQERIAEMATALRESVIKAVEGR